MSFFNVSKACSRCLTKIRCRCLNFFGGRSGSVCGVRHEDRARDVVVRVEFVCG